MQGRLRTQVGHLPLPRAPLSLGPEQVSRGLMKKTQLGESVPALTHPGEATSFHSSNKYLSAAPDLPGPEPEAVTGAGSSSKTLSQSRTLGACETGSGPGGVLALQAVCAELAA